MKLKLLAFACAFSCLGATWSITTSCDEVKGAVRDDGMVGAEVKSIMEKAALALSEERFDAYREYCDRIAHFLQRGVFSPNYRIGDGVGTTYLGLAAKHGLAEIVLLFLTESNVNVGLTSLEGSSTQCLCSPLMLAARYGHVEVVRILQQHGQSRGLTKTLNQRDSSDLGYSALHYALVGPTCSLSAACAMTDEEKERRAEIVGMLLELGIDHLLPTKPGKTPLQLAELVKNEKAKGYIQILTLPGEIEEIYEAIDKLHVDLEQGALLDHRMLGHLQQKVQTLEARLCELVQVSE